MPHPIRLLVLSGVLASCPAPALGADALAPAIVAGWTDYVAATESRIAQEVALADSRPERFLVQDFLPLAEQRRREVLSGAVVLGEMQSRRGNGSALDVPSALVHHWRGAVFIPNVTLEELLARLQSDVPHQEDVLRSAVLERGPNRLRVYLRLQRKKVVTAVYNSEHVVTFRRLDPHRAVSASRSTRIAEVKDPDTSGERELPPDEDRGFLWRLHAYWRYQQVPGGVIAECESLSLSRRVPFVLRLVAGPIINSTARESMERTLLSLRQHFNPLAAR